MEPRSRKTCLQWLSSVSLTGFFTNNSFLWRAHIPLPVKNNWLSDLSLLCCDLSKTWHIFELAALRKKSWIFCVDLPRLHSFPKCFDELVSEIKLQSLYCQKDSVTQRCQAPSNECLKPSEAAIGKVLSWNSHSEVLIRGNCRNAMVISAFVRQLLWKSVGTLGCCSEKQRWVWCSVAFSFALGMGLSPGKDIAYHWAPLCKGNEE